MEIRYHVGKHDGSRLVRGWNELDDVPLLGPTYYCGGLRRIVDVPLILILSSIVHRDHQRIR